MKRMKWWESKLGVNVYCQEVWNYTILVYSDALPLRWWGFLNWLFHSAERLLLEQLFVWSFRNHSCGLHSIDNQWDMFKVLFCFLKIPLRMWASKDAKVLIQLLWTVILFWGEYLPCSIGKETHQSGFDNPTADLRAGLRLFRWSCWLFGLFCQCSFMLGFTAKVTGENTIKLGWFCMWSQLFFLHAKATPGV